MLTILHSGIAGTVQAACSGENTATASVPSAQVTKR